MKIELPKDVLGELPAPDSGGLVRVTAGIKLGPDGSAELVEINDQPLPTGGDGDGKDSEGKSDDDHPMPEGDMPDLNKAEQDIYS